MNVRQYNEVNWGVKWMSDKTDKWMVNRAVKWMSDNTMG